MGVDILTYYIVSYLFNYITYVIVVIFFSIAGGLMRLRFFTQTDTFILFLFFVGWGHLLVSLGLLMSSFISTRRGAIISGYCLSLFGILLALVISDGVFGEIYNGGSPLPPYLYIFPFFSLVRVVYKMNYACAILQNCYKLEHLSFYDELTTALASMYLLSLVFIIISCYFEQIIPKQYGVTQPVCFCCKKLKRSLESAREREGERTRSRSSSYNDLSATRMDMDVKAEMIRANNSAPNDCPILIRNLTKEYPENKKIAVDSISFTVQKGECFGLLGENGSGKTTLINLLCGIFSPTSGDGFILGHHIVKEFTSVQKSIGFCPQQDLLWNDLTVKEHIYFYSTIKGVPASEVDGHIFTSLLSVGLWEERDSFVRNLSGGMRRRLSLGISLVGNSSVIFLDEPTRDLDPISRKHIWTVLEGMYLYILHLFMYICIASCTMPNACAHFVLLLYP
jgi:ABC-type Na+ transport system ATPase subunit NatA